MLEVVSENEAPRFALQNGVLRSGRKGFFSRLKLRFEILARPEFHAFGSFDFNLVARFWVDAHPRLPIYDLKSSKTNQLHRFAFAQASLDTFNDGFDRALREGFAGRFAERFLHGFHEFCFIHKWDALLVEG